MYSGGYIAGGPLIRKFRIGTTVYEGSVVMRDTNKYAEAMIASAESAVNALGFTLEAGTYAVASPHVFVRCEANPYVIVEGIASAGATKDTAFSTSTSSQILLQDTASTTVFTDTAVATLSYAAGLLIPLTGAYAGHIRTITSQANSTSTTVTVPFPGSIAVGTYALRTYSPGNEGVETVATEFNQFNNLLGAGETLNDAQGEYVVWDVLVDDQSCAQSNTINIKNGTSPTVRFQCLFMDHAFASLATG
jgi:hypothetical protein